jgi:thymidylate synthase (FAD)
MEVNLVSYSQTDGNFLIDSANVMELIAFCARVSNPENQMNKDTSERLLKYLIKHKHWSPFEMVSACLEIKTTRDIARQILRHRSFSFQEFSQRYAVAQGYEKREPRMQDKSNRQNSLDTDVDEIHLEWDSLQDEVISVCNSNYNRALEMGIAKEQARALLPEGLTKSTMYVNGTLRSWIHFIELRRGVETQKEHRLIALACAEIINKVFPQQVWHKDWEW